MPPANKSASKRKADTQAPAALQPSDDESQPDAVVDLTPAQIAKKAFMGAVSQTCPEAKHSSGGSNAASAEGVVLRASKIMVQGKAGMVPKMQLTVAVTKFMAAGAKDIISPGIDGFAFGMPTKTLEASPEEIAKNKDAKGPIVLDVVDGNTKCNYIGVLSSSFYMEGPQGAQDKKSGPGIETCTPGMRVLVSGITCTMSKTGTALYTNAKKVTPLLDSVPVGEAADFIISEARANMVQPTAAFLWSMAMKGFFGLNYPDPVHQQQADACKAKWQQMVEGTASKLESVVLSMSGDASMNTQSTGLSMHVNRIRGISPEDAASGAPIFFCDLQKDAVTPYVAPLVQYGITPDNEATQMCCDLFDPEKRDRLPSSFVEAKVKQVTFKGNLVQIDYRLFYVFDKTAAILAIQEGNNPILHTTNAAASVKMTKKTAGPELVGSLFDAKIEMGIKEVIPFCNQASHASVYPRGADDLQIDGHFVSSAGFDFKDGIQKSGIQISEKFLDDKMLSGRGVFIHSDIDGASKVEASATAGPVPVLNKAGYQAISEGSFDFDSLKTSPGKVRKYYVIYDDCSSNVAKDPSLASSVDSGETHLSDIVPVVRDDGDFKAFLRENCLVYCVAV